MLRQPVVRLLLECFHSLVVDYALVLVVDYALVKTIWLLVVEMESRRPCLC